MGVTLENVSLFEGETKILDSISFTAPGAKITVILGESGSGKTTTLRIIAGTLKQSAGHVYIDEVCVDEMPPWKRNVGMVFQDAALFPHMSVYENVAFGLEARGWSAGDIHKRVLELLELVGIRDLANRKPHQISGGEKQRAALARALAPNPSVLLLDEPFSNLDMPLRKKLGEELITIQRKLSSTFIYVTHDLSEAFTFANYMVILHEGRMLQSASPEVIWRRPATPDVAKLIGMFPLYPEKAKGKSVLGQYEWDDDVILFVHPSDVKMLSSGDIEGEIISRRYEGGLAMIKVASKYGVLNFFANPEEKVAIGKKIRILINYDNIVAFPAPQNQYRESHP
ncbi:MAG: ABC transporter ATP-binding protein [Candidatus Korarchaeota archaeon]